ncbi:MmgE/PrpD family protein [Micromonospora sp. WMMA1363]|uniref:MmgE/PrpD family protein n=1 Tax=Micromonospora sp. WMMA1363 TaxID=3053985 RepID=UPI00259C8D90|nr:MmgE/PrpD family protein [Micromonospora sp. WMMA1363]MDM4722039.1 MmgE/PrpD family protein [Micromonospora sp. WMMA1363]
MTDDGSPQDPTGPTGRLCTWLAHTSADAIPAEVRDRARHLILDGIGCLLVGAHLPWSQVAVHSLAAADPGASVVAGWDRSTATSTAVLLNSSFIQGFELDDVSYNIPWHANAILLPVLLAVSGARGGITGAEFLRAEVLGFETGCRVGLALHGPQLIARGWHSGVVFGGPGAAAAAGVLHGLTAARFEDALGIAATQSCGLMSAQYESMVKRMQHGFAARNGLVAAMLAAGGYVGIKRVFERGYGGFLSVYGEGHDPDPSQVAAELGGRWYLMEQTVKPYAAMGYTHPAIAAALALRSVDRVEAEDITHIDIEVAEAVFGHTAFTVQRPITSVAAQMSVVYSTAVTLIDGAASLAQYRPDRINADDVWRLIERTSVSCDPAGDASHGRVRLVLRDGTTRERRVDAPPGSPKHPLDNAAVVDKYRELTGGVVDRRRQRSIEDLILHLDERPDGPAALLALLAPVAGDALADRG